MEIQRRRKWHNRSRTWGTLPEICVKIKRGAVMVPLYIKSGNCLSMIEQLQNPKEEVNYYE